MDKKIEALHEMCETLTRDLIETNEKIRSDGGKLSTAGLEYVDKLTHALKSVETTLAMIEAKTGEDQGGYSGRNGMRPYPYSYGYDGNYSGIPYERMGRSYADGPDISNGYGSDMSYARRRDSMGRYSRGNGYSYADEGMNEMLKEMRGMMGSMPEEKRREVERFLDKMERK